MHVLIGSPASDPARPRPALRQVSRGERAAAGRNYEPTNITMDNSSNFGERVKLLRETAYKLREAADIVLAEVQHMEAAAARFKQRIEKRERHTAATR